MNTLEPNIVFIKNKDHMYNLQLFVGILYSV